MTKELNKSPPMNEADDPLPRHWIARDCLTLLTGVSYAVLHPRNRVQLVYSNGYKLSAVVSQNLWKGGQLLSALVDARENGYMKRKLDKKLNKMPQPSANTRKPSTPGTTDGLECNQEHETSGGPYETAGY